MAMPRCLVAAAVLALSITGASACDDYPEELALAAAQRDAKLAQATPAQEQPIAQAAVPAPVQLAPAGAVPADTKVPPSQTAATTAGTLRQ
jgi:hypothetical protein